MELTVSETVDTAAVIPLLKLFPNFDIKPPVLEPRDPRIPLIDIVNNGRLCEKEVFPANLDRKSRLPLQLYLLKYHGKERSSMKMNSENV